jgi:hypothetical protein
MHVGAFFRLEALGEQQVHPIAPDRRRRGGPCAREDRMRRRQRSLPYVGVQPILIEHPEPEMIVVHRSVLVQPRAHVGSHRIGCRRSGEQLGVSGLCSLVAISVRSILDEVGYPIRVGLPLTTGRHACNLFG